MRDRRSPSARPHALPSPGLPLLGRSGPGAGLVAALAGLAVVVVGGCRAGAPPATEPHEVRAGLGEPSGIAVAGPGRYWVVDDDRGVILVEEDVSLVDEFFDQAPPAPWRVVAPMDDLEGLCLVPGPAGPRIVVVAEASGEVSEVTAEGKVTRLGVLARPAAGDLAKDRSNRGWEGLAFLPARLAPDGKDHLVAVHEKNPKAVALFAWPSLAPERVHALTGALDAALADLADVAVDARTAELVLLSDEGRRLARARISADMSALVMTEGSALELPVRRDEKPSGVAVDDSGGVWIVTDATGRLFRLGARP